MKNVFIFTLIFCLTSLNSLAVSADDSLIALKNAEKIIAELPDMAQYKPKDKENDKVLKSQNKAFDILTDATKAFEAASEDQLLLEQILVVSAAMNTKDPWRYASEIAYSIIDKDRKDFKKNPAKYKGRLEQFEKAMRKLPAKDQMELRKSIQNVQRERAHGNG